MACNCEAQNEIDKLYKMYGDKSTLKDNATFLDYVKLYGSNVLVYTCAVLCFPLLLIYILALLFWREDSTIHISDINILGKMSKKNV